MRSIERVQWKLHWEMESEIIATFGWLALAEARVSEK